MIIGEGNYSASMLLHCSKACSLEAWTVLMEDVYHLIKEKPIDANEVVWEALLGVDRI